MKWHVRVYVDNPGGAYNPAPLEEFDIEREENFLPMVGDFLRWCEGGDTVKVIARNFDFSSRRCALEVERVEPRWRFDG
jgi:hypothetical protein